MDTTKIKTNVVAKTEEQHQEELKKEKKSIILNYVWKIGLLLLTLIVMIRVPYVGSYIDGLIDFLFGMSKYVLYPLLIFVQVSIIFHIAPEKIVKSKKFIIWSAVGMLCIACMISGISDTVRYWGGAKPSFVTIMNEYCNNWVAYLKNPNYTWFANTTPVSGGIVAVLISYLFNFLSYIVLVLVALIVLCLCIFIIFNINYRSTKVGLKIRNWMIKKLGGTFKYDGFNELKEVKNNQNKFKKVAKADIVASAKDEDKISFDLLPETDVSCYNQNFKIAGNLQDKIQEFFKKNKIEAVPCELNVYTTFSELCFETKSKQDINNIIQNGEELTKFAKLDSFELTIRGNIVTFEIPNMYFSKVSIKSALMLFKNSKPLTAVFGLDKQSKVYTQNFKNQTSALILGKKGSGSATLAVLMALSMCYMTHPNDLELKVLSANSETTYASFTKLPHTNGKIADGIGECIDEINNLQNLINKRVSLFKSVDVTNIEQYNTTVKQPQDKMKHTLVLVSNFENIIKESFQNAKIINDILVNGPKAGVYTILQSYHAGIEAMDEAIFNACDQKYILKLETEGESERIFESQRGIQLHGTGDCLTFAKSIKDMIRLQICNINQAELIQDIEIIKTFYETKNEAVVEEEKTKTKTVKIETKKEEVKVEDKPKTVKIEPEVKEEPKVEEVKPKTKTVKIEPEVKEEIKVEDKPKTETIVVEPEAKPEEPKVEEVKVEEVKQEKPKIRIEPDDSKKTTEIKTKEIKIFTPFRFDPDSGVKDDEDKNNGKR